MEGSNVMTWMTVLRLWLMAAGRQKANMCNGRRRPPAFPRSQGRGAGVGLLKLYAMVCHLIALKYAYCERGLRDCNNVKIY